MSKSSLALAPTTSLGSGPGQPPIADRSEAYPLSEDYRRGVADGVRFAFERIGRDADVTLAAAVAELAPAAQLLPANTAFGDGPSPVSAAPIHPLPGGARATAEVVFVCWKWKSKYRHQYKAVHVNVLRNMVARHYAGAHRFICITDDADEVEGETFPLWHDCANLINSSGAHMPSCYRRLKLFDPATQALMGIAPGSRIVSLDLDTIVCGDLRPLVEREEEFVGWALRGRNHPRVFNGSMFLFQAGAMGEVWGDFVPTTSPDIAAKAGFRGSDQSWLTYRVGVQRPGWTQADGIYSYALDLRRTGAKLPHDARVVMFHGHIKPWHLAHVGRPGWAREHWV